MEPSAIEFCARKIVGTGDLRKALDVCLQSIETLERQQIQSGDKASPSVTLQHVRKVTNAAIGTHTDTRDSIKALRYNQKAVLVAVLVTHQVSPNPNKPQPFSRIQAKYIEIWKMKKYRLPPAMSANEFSDVLALLEVNGILFVKGSSVERSRLIGLKCCRQEVEEGVQDITVFKEILVDLLPSFDKEN